MTLHKRRRKRRKALSRPTAPKAITWGRFTVWMQRRHHNQTTDRWWVWPHGSTKAKVRRFAHGVEAEFWAWSWLARAHGIVPENQPDKR